MLASRQNSAGDEARRGALAAGAGYGLIAALGFGAFYVVLRAASAAAGGDPFWPVVAARATGTLILLAITLVVRWPRASQSPADRPSVYGGPERRPSTSLMSPMSPMSPMSLRPIELGTLIAAGALDVAANALYAAASATEIGPLAAVLASLFPITTIALARLFLHERLTPSQSAGVLSALAGVALIAWR
jgi:drug/metabolite transporter (DMT)-like permease